MNEKGFSMLEKTDITKASHPVTVAMMTNYSLSGALIDVLYKQTSVEANHMTFISLDDPQKKEAVNSVKEPKVIALLQNNVDDKSDAAQALVVEAQSVTSPKISNATLAVQMKDPKSSQNFIMGIFLSKNEAGQSVFLLQPLYKTKQPLQIKPA